MNTLKLARISAKLSQEQLADLAGVSRVYVIRVEQYLHAKPNSKLLTVLSIKTGISAQDLMAGYLNERSIGNIDVLHRINTYPIPSWEEMSSPVGDHQTFREQLMDWYILPVSRIKFCQMFGLYPMTISRYEKGPQVKLPISLLRLYRDIFKVPDDLLR